MDKAISKEWTEEERLRVIGKLASDMRKEISQKQRVNQIAAYRVLETIEFVANMTAGFLEMDKQSIIEVEQGKWRS